MKTIGNVLAVALVVGLGVAWWVQDGQRQFFGPPAGSAAHAVQPAGSRAR